MNFVQIIEKKRDGGELSTAEIDWFIDAYTAGKIADYQVSALLMAVYLQGMSRRETVDLTRAMAQSGDQLDLHDIAPFVVDKHSSGGVGDKTTLVVAPIVAACGVPVGKMSGRGLGSSGGTLDKLESFAGWTSALTLAQFRAQLAEIGFVLAGQSADLAPADGKLYALRDVTGTVASVPLIAGSIMSKKLAGGADAIVLDVKVGSGAFMETVEQARALAQIMVNIGNDALRADGTGRKTVAVLSDMNQPLGHAIGNSLEVIEAIDVLNGSNEPADFWAHCLEISAHMLLLANKAPDLAAARQLAIQVRDSGAALTIFRQMVVAQGGDGAAVDDFSRLPQAKFSAEIPSPQSGYIASVDTGAIGWAAVNLGGGRRMKSDKIEHGVGFILPAKVGDYFAVGERLGTVYANDEIKLATAIDEVLAALTWSDSVVKPLPHFYGLVE